MIRIVARFAFAVEPLEQVEDLRLDRHVERGRRLVGDQHLGLERQRHRDHRPLPHARRRTRAGSASTRRSGVGDADRVEQLDRRARAPRPRRCRAVGPDRLDDLVADPVDGVERGHRVLEDHRDPLAAHLAAARLSLSVDQLLAVELHRALDPRVGRAGEADDRLRGDALARAGLADDRQHLARRRGRRRRRRPPAAARLRWRSRPAGRSTREQRRSALIAPTSPAAPAGRGRRRRCRPGR